MQLAVRSALGELSQLAFPKDSKKNMFSKILKVEFEVIEKRTIRCYECRKKKLENIVQAALCSLRRRKSQLDLSGKDLD